MSEQHAKGYRDGFSIAWQLAASDQKERQYANAKQVACLKRRIAALRKALRMTVIDTTETYVRECAAGALAADDRARRGKR
ncbi:MAG: hypothetical protein E6Q97_01310 [Desulfurellales bacterium]|nr:MAG: hypothetical protein E6Q97_01310 [Desulfurellales bacterium]